MTIPGDLLEEIERELVETCRALIRIGPASGALAELNRLAVLVSLRLGRPVSIVELFERLGDETGHLATLVRSLRDQNAVRRPNTLRGRANRAVLSLPRADPARGIAGGRVSRGRWKW